MIFKNVLENPNNEKYYKIRTDSKTFQNYMAINPYAVKIIKLFGYQKNQSKNVKLNSVSKDYFLSLKANISELKDLDKDFREALDTINN